MISVGIDVSKGKSKVCIMKPGGEVLAAPYDVQHTKNELNNLINTIRSYDEETKVVLESTGQYHFPVVKMLADNGIFVSVVNPLKMKHFASQDIRKVKTDRIDSIHIAMYGITYWNDLKESSLSADVYSELRILSRQYGYTVSLMVDAKNNLKRIIDSVMPGLDDYLKDNRQNNRLCDFAKHYWHYDNITKFSEKRFVNSVISWKKKKGYHLTEAQAKTIYALAQDGIPVLPCTSTTQLIVTEAAELICELEKTRKTILAQMTAFAKTLPEYSVVREMSCVGDILAVRVIAEIGDISRFKSKRSLIAYAGIDVPPYQSGKFNATERHITKRGNAYLRQIGFEIAQSYIMHKPKDDPIYDFILKKRSEGKCGKAAMIAGLNKFLRVYYGKVSEIYRV